MHSKAKKAKRWARWTKPKKEKRKTKNTNVHAKMCTGRIDNARAWIHICSAIKLIVYTFTARHNTIWFHAYTLVAEAIRRLFLWCIITSDKWILSSILIYIPNFLLNLFCTIPIGSVRLLSPNILLTGVTSGNHAFNFRIF